jgi:hypothetical protein
VIESGLVQVHIACAERGRVMQVVWENFISVHKYIVTSQQESVALKHHAELKAVRDELTRLKMAHAELQELHTTQVRPACCMPVCFSAAVLLFVLCANTMIADSLAHLVRAEIGRTDFAAGRGSEPESERPEE